MSELGKLLERPLPGGYEEKIETCDGTARRGEDREGRGRGRKEEGQRGKGKGGVHAWKFFTNISSWLQSVLNAAARLIY